MNSTQFQILTTAYSYQAKPKHPKPKMGKYKKNHIINNLKSWCKLRSQSLKAFTGSSWKRSPISCSGRGINVNWQEQSKGMNERAHDYMMISKSSTNTTSRMKFIGQNVENLIPQGRRNEQPTNRSSKIIRRRKWSAQGGWILWVMLGTHGSFESNIYLRLRIVAKGHEASPADKVVGYCDSITPYMRHEKLIGSWEQTCPHGEAGESSEHTKVNRGNNGNKIYQFG